MKKLILILTVFITAPSIMGIEGVGDKENATGEVQVKITEKTSKVPATESTNIASPDIEIEVVEKVDITPTLVSVKSVPTSVKSAAPVASVTEITPTNPDKNLIIYFILLIAIVIGILGLATIIPPQRTKKQ